MCGEIPNVGGNPRCGGGNPQCVGKSPECGQIPNVWGNLQCVVKSAMPPSSGWKVPWYATTTDPMVNMELIQQHQQTRIPPPQQQPPPPPFVFSYTFIPQPPNISTQVYIFHICHILQLCSSFNFTPSLSLDSSSDPFQPHNHLSLLQIVLDVGVGHVAFLELFTRDQGPILAPSSPHSSPRHFAPPLLHMHTANFWFLRDTGWHDWLILWR